MAREIVSWVAQGSADGFHSGANDECYCNRTPRALYLYNLEPSVAPVTSGHFQISCSSSHSSTMASATGIPERDPATITEEDEPLLGRPGDVTQSTHGLQYNLVLGW